MRLLRLNLDETPICMYLGGRRGNVFLSRSEPAVEHVSLGQRRAYMTHVAIICDDVAVQPHIPQVLIANERTLPARMLADLRSRLPANILLLRRKSAWNTTALCDTIVRRLAAALTANAPQRQAVLLLDVHKCHLGAAMLTACRERGIWVVYIPPKVTWLLQPLDVYVFHQFKIALFRECLRARIAAPGGATFDVPRLVNSLCAAIRCVLEGSPWAHAFDRCGFGLRQAGLGSRVRSALQLDAPPCMPDGRPSAEQLQRCFPKRVVAPVPLLLAPRGLPRAAVAPIAPQAIASPHGHVPPPMYPRRSARLAALPAGLPPPRPCAAGVAAPANLDPVPKHAWAKRLRPRPA